MKEFSKEQGWTTQEVTRPVSGAEQTAALEFLRFLSPNARRDSGTGVNSDDSAQLGMAFPEADRWECDLLMEFPDPSSARIDWGQQLRNIEVAVKLEPLRLSVPATVLLEVAYAADNTSIASVGSRELELRDGVGIARFGDLQVITGRPALEKLQCLQSGKYRLTARVESNGTYVARSSRNFYVNEDPPSRGANPYTISISVENHTAQQRRINSGDTIGVQVSVTNRTVEAQRFDLTASLGDLLLADMQGVEADGTPPGASPIRVAGVHAQIMVNPTERGPQEYVNLAPGKHGLRADLYLDGEVVAYASRTVYVEVDPVQPDEWPPFRIEQISGDGYHPRWQFQKNSQDDWVLQYPPAYPLYRALDASPRSNGTRMSGVSAFVIDICAEGIIEWAMEPLDDGDSSRLDELLGGVPVGADPNRWEDYREKMKELADLRRNREQVDKYGHLVRECAALSLNLFEERT